VTFIVLKRLILSIIGFIAIARDFEVDRVPKFESGWRGEIDRWGKPWTRSWAHPLAGWRFEFLELALCLVAVRSS